MLVNFLKTLFTTGMLAPYWLFLLGALFGKLLDDSGSVSAIAQAMTDKLGPSRAILAVVLAGTLTAWLSARPAAGRDAVLAVKEDW